MKKYFYLAVGLTITTMGAFNASAQRDNRHMESGVTTLIHNDKANPDDVEKTMKGNAPKAPKDNGLPRFAIVGKNNDFYLGIGGQFLGEGVFTWGDDMPSATLFTPSALTPSKPGNGGNTQFAWQTSSLYMNFVAMPGSDNQIGIFFKGHFMGKDDSFKLQHFYAKYRGLTAGFTHSLFTDGAAEPMTIDFEGPNGYPFLSLFTAYWEQNFTENFSGAIGIDAPTASMTTNSTTEKVNQRIPAVPLYLQYAWNDGASHVRLSGIVRPMQYRDLTESANKTVVGGGVQLSGMTKVVGNLGANFNAAYGRGIGNYLQDDNGLGLDVVATSTPGKMETVKSLGLTGGLNYTFSSKVSTNLTYSHLTNWLPEDAMVSDSQYRYGDYVAANVIYNINKFVSAGIEYDYGYRKDFNGNGLHANRLQCQLAVTF
ncbi:MAG: hypothetical protein K2K25_06180 [Muribaculaceae bacterium]|nr:hypothetical protein [Muribaculaceae bacterium]